MSEYNDSPPKAKPSLLVWAICGLLGAILLGLNAIKGATTLMADKVDGYYGK